MHEAYGQSPYSTKIMDFRGFDSSRILIKGWNSQVHKEFPKKFESSNLSRDNPSREIGRSSDSAAVPLLFALQPTAPGRRKKAQTTTVEHRGNDDDDDASDNTDVCDKITPPERRTRIIISFQNTESEAG